MTIRTFGWLTGRCHVRPAASMRRFAPWCTTTMKLIPPCAQLPKERYTTTFRIRRSKRLRTFCDAERKRARLETMGTTDHTPDRRIGITGRSEVRVRRRDLRCTLLSDWTTGSGVRIGLGFFVHTDFRRLFTRTDGRVGRYRALATVALALFGSTNSRVPSRGSMVAALGRSKMTVITCCLAPVAAPWAQPKRKVVLILARMSSAPVSCWR